MALNQRSIDVQKVKQTYDAKMQVKADKMKELGLKTRQLQQENDVIILALY